MADSNSKWVNKDMERILSLSGEDMTDREFAMVKEMALTEVALEETLSPEESKERAIEEFHAYAVQPHPEDVWNPNYRDIGQRIWPQHYRPRGPRI